MSENLLKISNFNKENISVKINDNAAERSGAIKQNK